MFQDWWDQPGKYEKNVWWEQNDTEQVREGFKKGSHQDNINLGTLLIV